VQERAVGEDEDEDIQILSEITAKQSPVKGNNAGELETMNPEESAEDASGGIDDDAGEENCVDDDAYGKAAELEEEEPMSESLICEHCAYVANDIQDARDHASVK
jgi:hypothetical protein